MKQTDSLTDLEKCTLLKMVTTEAKGKVQAFIQTSCESCRSHTVFVRCPSSRISPHGLH